MYKINNWCCFLIIFVLFINELKAQKETFTYDGSFSTSLSTAGDVKYDYYKEGREKIFHGRFNYNLRLSKNIGRINQYIRGKYLHGYKDGTWIDKIRLTNNKEAGDRYATGSISLKFSYEDGYPDGNWSFYSKKKYRKIKETRNGRPLWERKAEYKNSSAKLNFKLGRLIDSFFVQTDNFKVVGEFDEYGLFDGVWLIQNNKFQIKEVYNKGFLVLYEKRRIEDNNLVKRDDYKNNYEKKITRINKLMETTPTKLADLRFKTDTIKCFKKADYYLTKYLREKIYKNPYLVLGSLDGNRIEFPDFKGMYKVVIVNQVTEDEKKKIKEIKELTDELRDINNDLINATKDEFLFDQLKAVLKVVRYNKRLGEKYFCEANHYVAHQEIKDSRKAVKAKCNQMVRSMEKEPVFKDRRDALDFFIKILEEKLNESEKYQNIVKNKMLGRN